MKYIVLFMIVSFAFLGCEDLVDNQDEVPDPANGIGIPPVIKDGKTLQGVSIDISGANALAANVVSSAGVRANSDVISEPIVKIMKDGTVVAAISGLNDTGNATFPRVAFLTADTKGGVFIGFAQDPANAVIDTSNIRMLHVTEEGDITPIKAEGVSKGSVLPFEYDDSIQPQDPVIFGSNGTIYFVVRTGFNDIGGRVFKLSDVSSVAKPVTEAFGTIYQVKVDSRGRVYVHGGNHNKKILRAHVGKSSVSILESSADDEWISGLETFDRAYVVGNTLHSYNGNVRKRIDRAHGLLEIKFRNDAAAGGNLTYIFTIVLKAGHFLRWRDAEALPPFTIKNAVEIFKNSAGEVWAVQDRSRVAYPHNPYYSPYLYKPEREKAYLVRILDNQGRSGTDVLKHHVMDAPDGEQVLVAEYVNEFGRSYYTKPYRLSQDRGTVFYRYHRKKNWTQPRSQAVHEIAAIDIETGSIQDVTQHVPTDIKSVLHITNYSVGSSSLLFEGHDVSNAETKFFGNINISSGNYEYTPIISAGNLTNIEAF